MHSCSSCRGPSHVWAYRHIPRVYDYLWVAEDGMKMQGYNGSHLWDTAFAVQVRWRGMLQLHMLVLLWLRACAGVFELMRPAMRWLGRMPCLCCCSVNHPEVAATSCCCCSRRLLTLACWMWPAMH